MLDAQTKTRIVSARDILVCKVPDPKSQVKQITIQTFVQCKKERGWLTL